MAILLLPCFCKQLSIIIIIIIEVVSANTYFRQCSDGTVTTGVASMTQCVIIFILCLVQNMTNFSQLYGSSLTVGLLYSHNNCN